MLVDTYARTDARGPKAGSPRAAKSDRPEWAGLLVSAGSSVLFTARGGCVAGAGCGEWGPGAPYEKGQAVEDRRQSKCMLRTKAQRRQELLSRGSCKFGKRPANCDPWDPSRRRHRPTGPAEGDVLCPAGKRRFAEPRRRGV